jgi:hypothetical protein
MPKEIVTIPGDLSPFEAGALVLSVIAYPHERRKREPFAHALIYMALRATAAEMPRDERWAVSPAYLLQDAERAEQRLKKGLRVINDERLIAAKMVKPFLIRAMSDRDVRLRPYRSGGERGKSSEDSLPLTVNVLAENLARELADRRGKGKAGGSAANIKAKAWGPSKPVLHLCAALDYVLAELPLRPAPSGIGIGVDFGRLLDDRLAVAKLVEWGELLRPVVAALVEFEIGETDLIQVRAE